MPFHIRPARPGDRHDLFRVCLLTANSGTDATALYSDPDYPGLVWSVPYLDFEPDHTFVLEGDGAVLGYVVGTPDTRAFEARLDAGWWPELASRYAGRTAIGPSDPAVLNRIRTPERAAVDVLAHYPAHLHINLLPPAQSGGWGRRLIETQINALRAAGAKGVHLGVGPTNERAIGFYRHVGFTRLDQPGVVFGMAL